MIVKIFSIFDKASQAFGQPYFSQTRGTAIRSFTDLVNDPQSSCNKYPDHFTLFELGSFDDNNGVVESAVTSVINALEVIQDKPQA